MIEPFISQKRILRRLETLREERSRHIGDWREITENIRPSRGKYLYTGEESKRPTKVINGAPGIASRTLRAGLLSGVSSPSYPWFRLAFKGPDRELNDWGPAKVYLEARQSILYSVLAKSNFYNTFQVGYGDAGDFGNFCAIIDSDPKSVISCYLCSPGEYFFGQNYAGDIDTIYREYELTIAQLVDKFGIDNISQTLSDAYDRGEYDRRYKVCTAIEPNRDRQLDKAGPVSMEYSCVSVLVGESLPKNSKSLRDKEDKALLEHRGYATWPAPNLRWDISSGNVYGDGPGLMALGDARALQMIERRKGQAIDKLVTPPMQGPPQLRNSPISHVPGGMTYVDPNIAGSGSPISPIYALPYQAVTVIQGEIMQHEARINEAYYKDLFLLLAQTDRREITAREVEEKHEEKLLALGPMLQRTHRDALDNVIRRSDYLVNAAGMYPPPPPELAGKEISVEYVSTLAHAQQSVNVSSIERVFMFASTLAQTKPNVLEKLDEFAAIDYYADTLGVPARVIVETKKAKAKIAERAKAEADAQAAMAAPEAAQTAKTLSETDTTAPSALTDIMRGSQNL